ncbi:MAG TPA: hypothetical protein VI854_00370 [Acidimicrobiia bacterium]|nr:hypothetical protein [Acidimicrobiia bacterium]
MLRRLGVLLALAAAGWGLAPTPAEAQTTVPSLPPPMLPAKAWILVDADSGNVLGGQSHHEALPPASTTKLMTALVAIEKLAPDTILTVGPRAAGQPAMRIGMQEGQGWPFAPALHALLMVSANDAAYAVAEAASGSLEAFATDMNTAAGRYGMLDSTFNDPAGFDDSASFNGGSRVSAYDLAIAARNVLAVPQLAAIAVIPEYRFRGPLREHRLLNHNKLLRRYPGAIGLKTGYTRRAGHTFVGAATREGRTMIAVVLDADDTYGTAADLLDRGFATPKDDEGTGERLPSVKVRPFRPALASALVEDKVSETGEAAVAGGDGWRPGTGTLFLASTGGAALAYRRRTVRERRRRAERRRRMAENHRREMLRMVDPEGWDSGCHMEMSRRIETL